jgi:integrase
MEDPRILFKHALNYLARFRLPGFWVNPALNVDKLKNKKNIREIKPWPQGVYDDVVAAANPTLRRFIIAARNTGQRGSDVASMKLTDYNDGEVLVTQDKTDVKVWIPATPDLIELIAETPKDNILLFPNSAGRQWVASAWGARSESS